MTRYEFDIRRDFRIGQKPRKWEAEESEQRMYLAPEKIDFVGGIFAGDRERQLVLGMLLELMGTDAAVEYGRLDDWKAAVADREQRERAAG